MEKEVLTFHQICPISPNQGNVYENKNFTFQVYPIEDIFSAWSEMGGGGTLFNRKFLEKRVFTIQHIWPAKTKYVSVPDNLNVRKTKGTYFLSRFCRPDRWIPFLHWEGKGIYLFRQETLRNRSLHNTADLAKGAWWFDSFKSWKCSWE